MMNPLKEMREIIRTHSPVHAKHMSDEEILSWFRNKVSLAQEQLHNPNTIYVRPDIKAMAQRILDCWADYCILEELV